MELKEKTPAGKAWSIAWKIGFGYAIIGTAAWALREASQYDLIPDIGTLFGVWVTQSICCTIWAWFPVYGVFWWRQRRKKPDASSPENPPPGL